MSNKSVNLMQPWFPRGQYRDYSYVDHLETRNKKLYDKASSELKSAKNSLTSKSFKAERYSQLKSLWTQQREIEVAFLREFGFEDIKDTGSLLKAVNTVLQSKSLLQSVLDWIERTKDGTEEGEDSSTPAYQILKDRIPNAITEVITEYHDKNPEGVWGKYLVDLVYKRVSEELREVVESEGEEGQANPFSDLKGLLDGNSEEKKFVRKVLAEYGITEKKLQEFRYPTKSRSKKQQGIDDRLPKLKVNIKKQQGSVSEVFMDYFMSGLVANGNFKNFQVINKSTGKDNFQKADKILFVLDTKVEMDDKKKKRYERTMSKAFEKGVKEVRDTKEFSKRRQNANAIRKMMEKFDGFGIVQISEKSYDLKGEFFKKGGFAAENPTLKILGKVLSDNLKHPEKVEDLLFVLSNSGEGMINNSNVDAAVQVITTSIANFLFDDVSVTEQLGKTTEGAKAMRIFNLNGVMVPLSIFLEGVHEALTEGGAPIEDYVVVNFAQSEKATYNQTEGGTIEKDWTEFRNVILNKNKVNIRFFSGFVGFVERNLKALRS